YYKSLDLSDEEVQLRLNTNSRHRVHHKPPETPSDFWSSEPIKLSPEFKKHINEINLTNENLSKDKKFTSRSKYKQMFKKELNG
ncbi:MAG: DNA endonuclease rbbp8, partial [Paramarteilia canceri]